MKIGQKSKIGQKLKNYTENWKLEKKLNNYIKIEKLDKIEKLHKKLKIWQNWQMVKEGEKL